MNRRLFSAAALAVALAAPGAFAKNDAMSLIPNDAVSVGVVRLADARTSPLSAVLFQQTDKMTTDGDAAQFLADAGLEPTKDVDLVVVSTSPRAALGREADVLVAAEGRFNVERLTSALVKRGAVKKNGYYLLPESENGKGSDSSNGAVAFLDSHLTVVGSEGAVIEAIASRAAGGTSFATASGLGRDLARIDNKATAFALVDVPRASRITGGMNVGKSQHAQTVSAALKGVSTVAIWATDAGDSLKLGAFGLSTDDETLGLLEDTLRGALSAMRLAVSEKAPDLVTVLRRFTVTRTNESVTVSGSLPADTIKTFAAKAAQHHASR